MSYHLVIRPEADAEVDEASHWYEERRKGLGKEFLSGLDPDIRPGYTGIQYTVKVKSDADRAVI